MEFIKKR